MNLSVIQSGMQADGGSLHRLPWEIRYPDVAGPERQRENAQNEGKLVRRREKAGKTLRQKREQGTD